MFLCYGTSKTQNQGLSYIFLYYYCRIEYIICDKKLPPSSSSSKISLRTSCIPPSGLESPKTSSTSTASAVPSSSSSTEPTLDLAVLRLMRALIDFYRKRNIWIKKITQPFFKVEMYSKLGISKYFLKLMYDLWIYLLLFHLHYRFLNLHRV